MHGNLTLVPMGNIEADVLFDLTEGYSLTYLPVFGTCTHDVLPFTVNLTQQFDLMFSSTGGATTYDGDEVVAWDQHSIDK